MKLPVHSGVVVTAHVNADFDAMASIVAAGRLYPGSVLVFPGTQERHLKDFFIQSAIYMFNFKPPKDVDFSQVKTLVLVDTRQPDRLTHVQEILDRPEVDIHIYDHHPDAPGDLQGSVEVIKPWGACTSILVEEIKARGLSLSPDEATILALGIYEDTGLFSFTSTTEHDFLAAAWLKSMNMDLVTVSELLTRELTSEQVSLLNDLLKAAQTHDIKGVKIVVTAIAVDHYVRDFAQLVHKMMDMENMNAIVAIAQMQDRVHVVGRSRIETVDVGDLCSALGGGGHVYAASASVKDRSLVQVKEEVLALLFSQVNPRKIHSADIMSSPAVVIELDRSIAEAVTILTGLGLNVLPVVEPGTKKCVGLLDRDIASRAMSHGLGSLPVEEYMSGEFVSITPEADFYPIMQLIVSRRQPLIPVVNTNQEVEGVITRTDIMNVFIEESSRDHKNAGKEKIRDRNIKKIMYEILPRAVSDILRLAGRTADAMKTPVYVVGGFVRDVLLRRPNLDIDLVVEGDGLAYADRLAEALGGRVRTHPKFRTAVVIYGENQRIDVATARLEYYESPAALPMVELSSIKMDLYRRDFTVNSMAVRLNEHEFGQLVDFFGGQRDIKEKAIRVIHSLSFIEDPTRMMRAVRFEARFGFRIDGQAERLIKNAMDLKIMDKLSGVRVFNELKLMTREQKASIGLIRMDALGLLAAIHPALALTRQKAEALEETDRIMTWYGLLYNEQRVDPCTPYLLALCLDADAEQARDVAKRLLFSSRVSREFLETRQAVARAIDGLSQWSPTEARHLSKAYGILQDMPMEGLLHLMVRSRREEIRKIISHYLTELRKVRLEVSGYDLMALFNLPSGPELGRLMFQLLLDKIDGLAPETKDEIALARRYVTEAG